MLEISSVKKEIIRFLCENILKNILASRKLQQRQENTEEKPPTPQISIKTLVFKN